MKSPLRLAVDAHRLICEPRTSGATYLRELVDEWSRMADPPEVTLLLPRRPSETESAAEPVFACPNVKRVFPERPVDPIAAFRAQVFWQQKTIPSLLASGRPDLYFSPFHLTPQRPFGLRMVTTIHDLCFLTEPALSLGALIHRAQIWSACLRARRLICVSQFTCDMLARWSPRSARKATVVHNGVSVWAVPAEEALRRVRELDPELAARQYLLWIGTPTPRKNPALLFEIFAAHLQRFPAHRFVVVAPAPAHEALRARARAQGVLPALRLFSGLDTRTRDALYGSALALVFPSRCEGFGYPVLEAMFQGCPPVSFRNSPACEMVGQTVPLALEAAPGAFMDILGRLATMSDGERAQLSGSLRDRAARFSSKAMAEGTLNVLRAAAED